MSAPAERGSAITISGVGKRYSKHEDEPLLLTRALRLRGRSRRSHLWALRGVDLVVAPGECVGVVGRNGSGKSTMLRLLAGVTAPTEGHVAVRGRVAPLLSVGVGFHPELTGRENILVNGTILGLTREEIDDRVDDIVAFSGIAEFVDTPVKFYSSGMFVRLGFAVAVAAEPDVLLVDEVLAVGDVAFQMQCYDRIVALRDAGTTIVVVSHNLQAIRNVCDRAVVLHEGTVRHDGDTGHAVSLYHELAWASTKAEADTDDRATIEAVELVDVTGRRTAHVAAHDEVRFRFAVRFHEDVTDPIFGFALGDDAGQTVYSDSTPWRGAGRFEAGGTVVVDVRLRAALASGTYTAYGTVAAGDGSGPLSRPMELVFFVHGRDRVSGACDLAATFDLSRTADLGSPR